MTGIPNVAINVAKIDPVTETLFIGTDRGLYYLNFAGLWSQLGSGLPNAAIYDFTFTASNYLVVGTHGRGAWLNYMTPFITLNSLSNDSYYKSGIQASLTIQDPNGFINATYHWDSGSSNTATSNFNLNLPSGDGQHILYVSARDVAGNWKNVTFVFNVDNTSPKISLPTSQGTIVTSGSTINILISDSSPMLSIKYNWNGFANSTATLSNGDITIPVPKVNGKATLYIYAEDSAGNWAKQSFIFTIEPKSTTTTTSSIISKSGKTPGFEVGVLLVAVSFLLLIRKRKIE